MVSLSPTIKKATGLMNFISRLVGIMLKNLIIILFRISQKKLTLCFYYSPNVLIILKIIPNFILLFAIKMHIKTLKL